MPSSQLDRPIRVLLVEDNAGDVFLLTEMLADAAAPLHIEPVSLLADALRRLDAGGIDVVVSDLSLPDSHGLETFEKLHNHPARPPIIILSGLDDERMALRTVELGAQDYLVKGRVDQALLLRSIRYSITRAELDSALQKERNLLRDALHELKEKNAEMEDDLNLAREVQQAFLPQQFPTFPRDAAPEESAVRFYSRYLPTSALGGDFFHVLPLSDSQVAVFICDVMGHGVRAALVTAIQRALVEELAPLAGDPADFLTQMNGELLSILRRTRSPLFASAFHLVVDLSAGLIRFANAGHPRPLHIRRSQNTVDTLEMPGSQPGPALGVFDTSRYVTYSRPIAARDLLILFTDGIYEVENAEGEFYDPSLLVRAVQRLADQPTEQLFEQTLDEVRRFSARHAFEDDVCLVGVEISRLFRENSRAFSLAEPLSAGV